MDANLNSIEQLVDELEVAACKLLKPFLVEAAKNVVDQTHVLDIGDGVKVYRIKAKAPQSAQDALDATNKCKLLRMQLGEPSSNVNDRLLFDLGRLYERLNPIASAVTPTKSGPRKKNPGNRNHAQSDALRQLKKRAADEAVARWMKEDPNILESVAILRASEELKISPRTLRNWRNPKLSSSPA